MATKPTGAVKKPIESYQHGDKRRANNPPVGLVTPATDPDAGSNQTYLYDPHLDPQLQWAGKAERLSFDIPTRSLHVHERIDPRRLIEAVHQRNGNGNGAVPIQGTLFDAPEENPPLRDAIAFYRHPHGWSNRLIAGDSLLVMNSLLTKEGLGGKVQMVYIDPPYGIKYGSNFQPFVNKREVKDGKDEDLTAEPEQIRAFRDTWELGIHSYLSYLRDRLLLAHELLTDSGSVFVQISDENVHLVRNLMDEVFGVENFARLITFVKTGSMVSNQLGRTSDYLVWFAKNKKNMKYRQLFNEKIPDTFYKNVELSDGSIRKITQAESLDTLLLPKGAKIFQLVSMESAGPPKEDTPFEFEGEIFRPNKNNHWKLSYPDRMNALKKTKRIVKEGNKLRWKYYIADYPLKVLSEVWNDTAGFNPNQRYVVETRTKVVARCLLMTTDPGDLVFDPTCGSGTTAFVAEQWGRRWISCDTSRVALTLARQRLMTAGYKYYQLAYPDEGVGSGFNYKTVPHTTLKSIANNPDIEEGMTRAQINAAISRHTPQETLYDQPLEDNKRWRVSGPFTVEAVPAAAVRSIAEILAPAADPLRQADDPPPPADASIARSGETRRQSEWRDELWRTGIRGKAGQYIRFARLEPLGCRYLHADGETAPSDEGADSFRDRAPACDPQRIVVSFGLEYAPLEQRQVEQAIAEAQTLVPIPKLILFAAFQFDPEAAKDIDQTNWPGITLLKAQMNADLLTGDLKKKRASNESFWLIGQPDVEVSDFQFLVFRGRTGRLAEMATFQRLSGLNRLQEIQRLDWEELFLYALLSQGAAIRDYLKDTVGLDLDSGEYSQRPGSGSNREIPPLSWSSPKIISDCGEIVADRREWGAAELTQCRRAIKRLRANQGITARLQAIAQTLSFPIAAATKNCTLETRNLHSVAVHGFDYYNTKTGRIESGDAHQIAIWLLDTDYDGRSLYPRQVFFPQAGPKDGWARLAKNLKAEIDEELIEAYRGTVSLPFEPGEQRRIAVKIVDDRGIESLKVMELG